VPAKTAAPQAAQVSSQRAAAVESETAIQMHSVVLHEDAVTTFRIRWLRGRLISTGKLAVPSLDDNLSFRIEIDAGAMGISADALTRLLNQRVFAHPGAPLTGVHVSMQGGQMKINGTLHKGIAIPVELVGNISATAEGNIRLHATKLRALHVPVKGLLGAFGIKLAELVDTKRTKGVSVQGDDIILDPQQALPPPRQNGHLTDAHVDGNDLVAIFGNGREEAESMRQWRNYIRFRGGSLQFGKMTLRSTDMVMIDLSPQDWFEFHMDNYQKQLSAGYIKMNATGGLEAYVPDFSKLALDRYVPPPSGADPPELPVNK
jgi:hypothetical protein